MSDVAALNHLSSGKVRDIYAVGEDRLLLVASDRISTYDVVHPTPIPDKGKLLTGLTAFWLERTGEVCPNHLISFTEVPEEFRGRAMLVERLEMVPVECVVRGYITGSGLEGLPVHRRGLRDRASRRACASPSSCPSRSSRPPPRPRWATTTRTWTSTAPPRSWATARCSRSFAASRLRSTSWAPPTRASAGSSSPTRSSSSAAAPDGTIVLGDEVMTPDSSRFWPADGYAPGHGQPSFDKQYVRDWAAGSGWDKTPPAPALPDDVIERTRELYVDAYERITGEPFTAWLERSA